MMGIPESEYQYIFDRSNIILGAGDPEYVPEGADIAAALLTAGQELSNMVADLGRHRIEHPTDDLTSALVNANVDGEQLSAQELGSFFILLVVAGNETTRNAISHGLKLLTDNPDQRKLWASDFDRVAQGITSTGEGEFHRVAGGRQPTEAPGHIRPGRRAHARQQHL